MSDVATTGSGSPIYDVPRRPRKSGQRVLVWVIGIVVVVGMLISVLLPSLCRPRESANRVKCASNLRQIGAAIAQYAQAHGGEYPPSLSVLPAEQEIGTEVLTCPSSNDEKASAADIAGVVAELKAAETNQPGHKNCLSYVYIGRGLNVNSMSSTTIVAYESLDNHGGDGTNVLFGDGHVEFENKQKWSSLATAAGVAVLPSPTTRP